MPLLAFANPRLPWRTLMKLAVDRRTADRASVCRCTTCAVAHRSEEIRPWRGFQVRGRVRLRGRPSGARLRPSAPLAEQYLGGVDRVAARQHLPATLTDVRFGDGGGPSFPMAPGTCHTQGRGPATDVWV